MCLMAKDLLGADTGSLSSDFVIPLMKRKPLSRMSSQNVYSGGDQCENDDAVLKPTRLKLYDKGAQLLTIGVQGF